MLFTSIHGHPEAEFPFFLGYEDERGEGAGEGFNFNYPLPAGSGWEAWSAALEQACNEIESYGADIVVVSLGVDTFKDDPISQFKLDSPDYLAMGKRIAPRSRWEQDGRCITCACPRARSSGRSSSPARAAAAP